MAQAATVVSETGLICPHGTPRELVPAMKSHTESGPGKPSHPTDSKRLNLFPDGHLDSVRDHPVATSSARPQSWASIVRGPFLARLASPHDIAHGGSRCPGKVIGTTSSVRWKKRERKESDGPRRVNLTAIGLPGVPEIQNLMGTVAVAAYRDSLS